MKKLIVRVGIAIVVLIIVAALAVHLFLDGAVKRGVETVGSKITKVDVKLAGVNISVLSGSGKIKGLVIGNPEGFKTASAIQVGSAHLALKPTSVLSEKIIIHSINLEGPEITLEGGLGGNNLSKLLDNIDSVASTEDKSTTKSQTAPKKIQVDDFRITGAKVHVALTELGGKSETVTIPEIHLTNLGTGADGITPAELSKRVIQEIVQESRKAATKLIADIGKGAVDLGKNLGTNATGTVEKATKGIGDLFKKKKE
jgi:uncharacterized protein involved in outer membrane biogenesis